MGRASRRKRERAEAAEPAAAASPRTRKPYVFLGAVLAAALVFAWGAWQFVRESSAPAPEALVLPDPDRSAMTAPVARAISQARAVALASPGAASVVGHYCQVLHAHWLHEEAADCYDVARRLAPRDFRWVYLLAGVEEVLGADGERVLGLFRDAIGLAPDFPPLQIRYGDALLRLGLWEEARQAYGKAVELDPQLVLAHRGLGQAANLLGDGAAAVSHLERAAALAPGDRISQTALARAYTLTGQQDRAAEAASRAQQLSGQAGLPDYVYHQVDKLRVDPESLRASFARAVREGDRQKALEAATLLEESGAPEARRQLVLAAKQRANELAFSGNFDEALVEYERASELAPNDPEIQHNWGTVLLRRGELEAAAGHFEQAVRLNPRSADSLFNLGVVLESLGRQDEAIARFRQAAAINPDHVAVTRLAELEESP